jgi:hypothetical protein
MRAQPSDSGAGLERPGAPSWRRGGDPSGARGRSEEADVDAPVISTSSGNEQPWQAQKRPRVSGHVPSELGSAGASGSPNIGQVEQHPFEARSIRFSRIHLPQCLDLTHANERFHGLRVI